jgi:hypothetical protein
MVESRAAAAKIIFAYAITFALGGLAISVLSYRFLFPALPAQAPIRKAAFLDQGWTADQRAQYYRTSQGSLIIPYSWFMALERPEPGNHEQFATQENLARYNLVADQGSPYNPDNLPIGFTSQVIDDDHLESMGCGSPPCRPGSALHRKWLTYTCAACHVEQLNYKGKSVIVDGGRGRWNFTVFNTTLANLLLVTRYEPAMFDRFAAKVIRIEKRSSLPGEKAVVRKELDEYLRSPVIVSALKAIVKRTYPTEEGYGRIDALGRGNNGQFEPLDPRNVLPANAPVLIPPLWYSHDFDWVQTVGAIRQPLGRNFAESWVVNSPVDLVNPDPAKRFHTTIRIPHMFWMETLLSVMSPPKWPEAVFGKVDQSAVELGRYLYEEKAFDHALDPAEEQWCPDAASADSYAPCPNPGMPRKGLCARCHTATEANPNENGKRYWQLPVYKVSVLDTDPLDAVNFSSRKVYTGVLKDLFAGKEEVGVGEALSRTTTQIVATEMDHQKIPLTDRLAEVGFRSNDFRAPLGYPARPLTGYWATPPYLHNGSVPNLYELMSPVSERSSIFWTGDPEFDPVKVGYRAEKFTGGFEFRTRRSLAGAVQNSIQELFAGHFQFRRDVDGNSNLGHEFRNAPRGTKGVIGPYLSPKERLAIIEYMKLMPGLKSPDGGEEFRRRTDLLKQMDQQYLHNHPRRKMVPSQVQSGPRSGREVVFDFRGRSAAKVSTAIGRNCPTINAKMASPELAIM